MTYRATAKCLAGEDELVEEFEGRTIQHLVSQIQIRFHQHGNGLWVVFIDPENPPRKLWWYIQLFKTPRIRYHMNLRVETKPDRLVIRAQRP